MQIKNGTGYTHFTSGYLYQESPVPATSSHDHMKEFLSQISEEDFDGLLFSSFSANSRVLKKQIQPQWLEHIDVYVFHRILNMFIDHKWTCSVNCC